VLEFLARTIRQKIEIKGIQTGKEEVKLSLFSDHIILYLKDSKGFTEKLLISIDSFNKVIGYKINIQKSIYIYIYTHTNNEQIENEIRKTIPLAIASEFLII
jgi:hypothetical protein